MLFWFFAKLVILVVALIFICYKKGEPLAWRWGSRWDGQGAERRGVSGEISDWRRYQSTPAMKKIQLVLLVMIIIGLILLATQKLWVGGVVDFILKNYH